MSEEEEVDDMIARAIADNWINYDKPTRERIIQNDPATVRRFGLKIDAPYEPMFEGDEYDRDDQGRFA